MAVAAWRCDDLAVQTLRALLATVSCLLLGAHFLRSGGVAVALAVAALPGLLALRRGWAVRAVQVVLAAGAVEWLRTLVLLVGARRALGQPSARLAAILLAAAAISAVAAVLLRNWRRPPSSPVPAAAAEAA